MSIDVQAIPPATSEAVALAAIVAWSAECPNWQRDALRRLCARDKLETTDFDELLALCKDDGAAGGGQPLTANHVRDPSAGSAVVTLTALHGLQHVNALAIGERLTFDKTGITIIYGDNGAGKSGYARVLKKLCRARSPKNDTILSNVYSANSGLPTANIDFCVSGQNKSVTWINGQSSDAMLSAVSVFDSRTANIHVDQTNDVAYTPLPLKILAGLAQACQELKTRLTAESKALEAQKPAVLVTAKCQPGTAVGRLIAGLSAKTKPQDVAALAGLTAEQQARLETLKADLGADPARTARQLQAQKTKIVTTIARLEALALAIGDDRVTALRAAQVGFTTAKAAVAAASADLFSGEPLPNIGSDVWKALWEAARAYSRVSAYPDLPFPVTEPDARCVLCHQELDAAAADRLNRFEAFIQNESKKREQDARTTYDAALSALGEARLPCAEFLTLLALVRDDLGDTALAEELRGAVLLALWRLRAIVRTHQQSPAPILPTAALLPVAALQRSAEGLEKRVAALLTENDSPERRALQAERDELADRAWLVLVQADVLAQVERLKAIAALTKAQKDTSTNRITTKSAEVAQTLVTNMLRSRFAVEVDKLGVAGLAIELRQDKTSQGVPFFRVSLINKPTETVGNVLSEGEHRCVALAAFLAELATVDASSAIVFDDPVSSLDHIHREKVASRLAAEGLNRQIIVFTHDIAFLFLLHEACRSANTHVGFRSISRGAEQAGFCQPNPPPNAQPVDKVVEALQRQITNQKIQYERGDQEEWYRTVRSLQEQLRTTWERAVEDALSPVVKRLASKVDTKNLLKITVIDANDCKVMRDAFGRCSEMLHSQPGELNPALPAPAVIEAEIGVLRDWIANLRQRQDNIA